MAIASKLKSFIGKSCEPFDVEVEKGQIRRFASAVGENNLLHFDEAVAQAAGYPSLVAPPTFPAALYDTLAINELLELDTQATMHRDEEYEYFRPICAGDVLTITHSVVDAYDQRTPKGRLLFLVIETRGNDRKDKLVFKGRRVLVEIKQ